MSQETPSSVAKPHESVAIRDKDDVAFNLAFVESAIATTPYAGNLHHLVTTSSTNTLALEAARQNVPAGVWVADEQTAGRGRGGHTWHSEPGSGLYVSILARPRLFGVDALKLSLAAGLAAAHAVEQTCALKIDLRWPNDLMLDQADGTQKKFGGILTESSIDGGTGALAYAVIGIGMNLNHESFPAELASAATSLRITLGYSVSREKLLAALLLALNTEIALVEAEVQGLLETSLADRFEARSTWVRNLPVHVDEDGGYTGITAGLTPQGLLLVRLEDGTLKTVRHGGVRRQ